MNFSRYREAEIVGKMKSYNFCHYLILIVLHLQVCDQQKWMDTVTGTHYIWNYIFKMKFPAKVLQVISVNYYR